MKNILFIVKRWEGGVGNVVKGYEKYLNRRGYKVYTVSREDDLDSYTLRSSIRKIRKIVKKRDYDKIITNDWSLALPLLFPWPIRYKAHYTIFHGVQFGVGYWLQKFVGYVMETFGRLIVVGPNIAKKFKYSKRVDNGVDLEIFKQLKSNEFDADNIGFANYPTDFYNYKKVYNSVEKINKKNFLLAQGLNKKEMAKFYNSLGCFISLPGDITGYNLVWAEALASGVPKIIGNNAGIGPELPIYRIDGEITEDKIVKAINEAKHINSEERDKHLKKISLDRATDELIKALDLDNGKENKEKS